MNYISIVEAAERWGITPRRAQELCRIGAVDGAKRLGRAWLIPISAEKPLDRRTKAAKSEQASAEAPERPKFNPFVIHTNIYRRPGSADRLVGELSGNPTLAGLLSAQIAYLRGEIDLAEQQSEALLGEDDDFGLRLAALSVMTMCAVWNGDRYAWNRAHDAMSDIKCKSKLEESLLALRLAADSSAIYDASGFPEWFRSGAFERLPLEYYGSLRGYYIKYLYISAYDLACGRLVLEDAKGLALMRTLPYLIGPLLSQAKIEETLVPEIYLHLIGATVYHNLGHKEDAVANLDRAIELALPDRLYTPLVEYRTGLDTLLDERLIRLDPDATKHVRELHRRLNDGRLRLHNSVLGREVSHTLTTREREVAKLAVFGVSNAEIAKRLNIELHSVKHYIYSAMNKVGANKRSELGMYI